MNFYLKEKNGFIPDLEYGERGSELSCFIPDGISWTQINYGQGEGQVLINGCEWGFYYTDNDSIGVTLHDGVVSLEESLHFINAVKEKIFGNHSADVSILLIGIDDGVNTENIKLFLNANSRGVL